MDPLWRRGAEGKDKGDSMNEHGRERTVTWRIDPADLAHRLRSLAVDAHRTLKSRDAGMNELIELSRRIDELRAGTQDPRLIEIDRWLRKAQEMIETRCRSGNQIDPQFSVL